MKEIKVTVNTWYVVEGAAGATVINPLTNRAIATVEDGKQASFLATTPYVVASDDSVSVFKAPFNSAPAKLKLLGLLGGGSSTGLPAGYLEASFLESKGSQCLLPFVVLRTQTIVCTVQIISATGKILGYYEKNADNATRALSYETYQDTLLRLCVDGSYPMLKREDLHIKRTVTFEPMSNNKINVFSSDFSSTHYFDQTFVVTNPIGIFSNNGDGWSTAGRMWNFEVYDESKKTIHSLVPVIDNNGVACAYDMVDKTTHYNKGSKSFVIGMTREHAVKLAKLPASGGTLTISLPSSIVSGDTVTDSAVNAALTTARANGWSITVRTYEEEETAAASTFGLRRIWVRKTLDEHGSYVDADGNRWQVDWCVTIYTPDDSTPDMHGYELFRSVEAATEYWGLTPYVDPAWEEELLTETN